MSPLVSGLVGEWVAPVEPGSADTTLLRFLDDGTAEQVRMSRSRGVREIPLGSFRVYADTAGIQMLCFSFRRGRALSSCRYFRVDTLTEGPGQIRRRLQLLRWVEEKRGAPEIWTERK